ncbi:hypothetical protein CC80DRAFT_536466 [Byssothecium circinans]|uniref:Uncharacterized protein n=1 Tax=Byssothecium circinans TaxID=147558 RepID=A0A6A5U1J1_9PLEO|nr:hypothetical protein CC80DRAFT_536466 [Byssothecium circinans]
MTTPTLTAPSPPPPHPAPHESERDRTRASHLDNLITSHILTVITTLLVLLMLLWHASSSDLINDYGMPRQWEKQFLRMQFEGGSGVVWGGMFVMIPIDFLHALLALGWYHGCRFERGEDMSVVIIPGAVRARESRRREAEREREREDAEEAASMTVLYSPSPRPSQSTTRSTTTNNNKNNNNDKNAGQHHPPPSSPSSSYTTTSASASTLVSNTSQKSHNSHKKEERVPIPLPQHVPSTMHPLFSAKLPPGQKFWALCGFDCLLIALLAAHVGMFVTRMPTNLKVCDRDFGVWGSEGDPTQTDRMKTALNMQHRCYRINVDIHVGGGFAMAVCTLLLALHAFHLVYRLYERREFGQRGFAPEGAGAGADDKPMKKTVDEENGDYFPKSKGIPTVKPETDILGQIDGGCTTNIHSTNTTTAAAAATTSLIIDTETGIRFRDWSRERDACTYGRGYRGRRQFGSLADYGNVNGDGRSHGRGRGEGGDGDGDGDGAERWREVLLECLVP